eukprot:scaffold48691_cov35-Tisochrysis_lutea.AAC.1
MGCICERIAHATAAAAVAVKACCCCCAGNGSSYFVFLSVGLALTGPWIYRVWKALSSEFTKEKKRTKKKTT